MITPIRIVLAAGVVLATTLFTSLAHAQESSLDPRWEALRENTEIDNALLLVMVGTFIVEDCDSIDVRRARSTPYLIGLARRAISMGYSRAEVEEFIEDPAEVARVEARADAYLAQYGATRGDDSSLCRLGRDEIARGSAIGRMLREG